MAEEHQVNVRIRVHFSPAVSAQSQQRARFSRARSTLHDILEYSSDHVIDQRREVPNHVAAARSGIVFPTDAFVRGGDQRLHSLKKPGALETAIQ